jgi:hypothetical protein
MPHKAKMRQSRLAAYPDIGSEPVEYMWLYLIFYNFVFK